MLRSNVLLPQPLPPMMINTSPRLTVKLRSRIKTTEPYPRERLRTVIFASAAISFGLSLFISHSDYVKDHGQGAASRDDKNDARDHGRGGRLADGRGTGAALHAAQTPRKGDQHTINHALKDTADQRG